MLSGPAAGKMNLELRRTASHFLAEGKGEEPISVLVRLAGTETEAARGKLEHAGMNVESVVGDVASGKIPARALAGVAALDVVIQVELAQKLEIQ